jgi:PEP-CTERM motif
MIDPHGYSKYLSAVAETLVFLTTLNFATGAIMKLLNQFLAGLTLSVTMFANQAAAEINGLGIYHFNGLCLDCVRELRTEQFIPSIATATLEIRPGGIAASEFEYHSALFPELTATSIDYLYFDPINPPFANSLIRFHTAPTLLPFYNVFETLWIFSTDSVGNWNLAPSYLSTADFGVHGTWDISVTAVPEPETYAMMLAGLGLLGFAARRGKTKATA